MSPFGCFCGKHSFSLSNTTLRFKPSLSPHFGFGASLKPVVQMFTIVSNAAWSAALTSVKATAGVFHVNKDPSGLVLNDAVWHAHGLA